MITIDADNYGAEGSTFDCLITKKTILEGLWVKFECIRFSAALDDWSDLSASAITVVEANTARGYTPVWQGEIDADNDAGGSCNEVNQNVLIATNGHLKTNADPATNGGADLANGAFRCYSSGGALRFEFIYDGGADDGDATLGDFAGGTGIKWDQSAATLTVKVDSAGGLTVAGGGDINLVGHDSSPGKIIFDGSSYDVEVWANTVGSSFFIKPSDDNVSDCYIGFEDGASSKRFNDIRLFAQQYIYIYAGDTVGFDEGSYIQLGGGESTANFLNIRIYDKTDGDSQTITYEYDQIYPVRDDFTSLGLSSNTWKEFHSQKIVTYDTSTPIVIAPNAGAGAPSHSAAKGALYVTSAGVLYINTDGSTTWAKVGAQ